MKALILLAFICLAKKTSCFCLYDGVNYISEGKYFINHNSWFLCRTSYVVPPIMKNDNVVLVFSNITCDCSNSYLQVSDERNPSPKDVCQNTSSPIPSVLYASRRSRWIAINKKGTFSAVLHIRFLSKEDLITTTPATKTTGYFTTQTDSTEIPTSVVPQTSYMTLVPQTTTISVIDKTCGRPGIKPDESGLKIVGGKPAIPKSWPWQVLLRDGGALCGGVLINNQWVLTAGHCNFYLNTLFASFGEHDRTNLTDNVIIVKPDKLIPHPNYGNPYNNFKYDWDIALLRLKTPIVFTDVISPVCLPGGRLPVIGSTGMVTGWGKLEYNGTTSNVLMQASQTIMEPDICTPEIDTLTSRQICAGTLSPVQASCSGDSGGPFVLKDEFNDSYYLAGIVSSGYDRCHGRTIYTSVVEFEDWIAETIANN